MNYTYSMKFYIFFVIAFEIITIIMIYIYIKQTYIYKTVINTE